MRSSAQRRLGELELIECIGVGGSAEVWSARRAGKPGLLAVKILRIETREPARDVVARELRVSARLEHPNIVSVLDVVEHRERIGLVMELCRGSLADWARVQGPLPPWWIAEIGIQALAGLHAAHRAGVVHCDVKPANLLVTQRGTIALADFGIARVRDPSSTTAGTSSLWGTLPFLAPERRYGTPPDARADIYGVAATLAFAALADVAGDLFAPQVEERVMQRLPLPLAQVILRAGAYLPADRPSDAAEMASALASIQAALAGRDEADATALELRARLDTRVPPRTRSAGRAPIVLASAGALALGGAVVWTSTGRDDAGVPREQPPQCDDSPGSVREVKRRGPRETLDAVVADLDADGRADVAFTNQLGGTLSIYWGGETPLEDRGDIPIRRSGLRPAVGDVDGDGIADLVLAHPDLGSLSLLRGRGERRFAEAEEIFQGPAPGRVELVDWDRDGMLDLLMQLLTEARCTAWRRGEGEGTLAPHACIGAASDLIDPYGASPPAVFRRTDDGWLVRHLRGVGDQMGDSLPIASLDELAIGSTVEIMVRDADADGADEVYVAAIGGREPALLRIVPVGRACMLWPPSGFAAFGFADVADVNGDGLLDAVTRSTCEGCESVHAVVLGVAR